MYKTVSIVSHMMPDQSPKAAPYTPMMLHEQRNLSSARLVEPPDT